MGAFNLETCARPNILRLEPYRCARDDYKDDGTNVLLDANENAFGPSLALSPDGQLLINGDASQGANGTSTANGTDKKQHTSSPTSSIDFLGLNRYPDPHQIELKQLFCNLRNSAARPHSTSPLTPEHLFAGVGSDEAIDAILRSFCAPGRDKLLICPPTYGMYSVSACINDVPIVKVPLDTTPGPLSSTALDGYQLRPGAVNAALSADPSIKVVYITSPGNPTGNMVRKADVRAILEHPTWNGVVVVDEAYIDFASDGDDDDDPSEGGAASLATWVPEWPNLIVLQTMSKAFGLAGIRVGVAIADPAVARLFNSLKAPYNVASPSSALAIQALQPEGGLAVMRKHREQIIAQRGRLVRDLPRIPGVGRLRGGKHANFLLVEMLDLRGSDVQQEQREKAQPSNEIALAVYERLAEQKGVVVRFRGKEEGCLGCLRITVGTERENDAFLQSLEVVLADIAKGRSSVRGVDGRQELRDEVRANDVVA